jgi:hypothetical protein
VGSWPGIQSSVYSPYYALTQLYAAADVYIDYLYRVTTEPTLKEEYNQKRLTKTFTTYTMPLWPFAGFNQLEVGPPSAPTEYAWWNASGVPNPNIQYMFPFNETSFNADPVNYGTTNYLENFWTGTWYYNGTGTGARAWWNINVRGNRTKIFDVLQDLATNYTPPNTPNTKPVWGTLSDPYYSNTIELILRQS